MATEIPISDGSNNNEAHISTATGVLGLVHDLGNIANATYHKIHELWSFDETLHSLLVTLARDVSLLETWCRAMGYSLPMTATGGDELGISARTPSQIPQLESRLRLPRARETMELTLSSSLELLRRILTGLSYVSSTDMTKIDAFIVSSGTANIQVARQGSGTAVELGQASAVPSHSALVDMLKRLNIVDDPPPLHRKATSILNKLLPHIDGLIRRLEDHTQTLEIFVIGAKLDVLIQVPPRLVDFQVMQDSLPRVIEETMNKLQHRQIFEAAINSYLYMKDIPPSRAQMNYMLKHHIADLAPVLRATENTGGAVSFRGSPCLVEWISDLAASTEEDMANIEGRLNSLVYRLSMVSPGDYRILPPINFIQDSRDEQVRYGLLYDIPRPFDVGRDIVVSLASLFASPSFPLEQRFKLALRLANALRQFQTCQWLHEKLSSHNVVFIARQDSPGNVSLHEPYIKGFGTSRFHTADSDKRVAGTMENDYYQHPLRRSQIKEGARAGKATHRYRAEFDIYSLGRVLLEIAAWDIVDESKLGEATELGDDNAFDDALRHLPSDVGSTYTDAVLWCLGRARHSPMEESRLTERPDTQQVDQAWSPLLIGLYEENVLMKIAECRV